jgi:arginase
MKAQLLGVPLDLGAKNLGVDVGPDAFRYRQLIEKLAQAGIEVTDSGDVACRPREQLEPGNNKLRYIDEIVRVCNELAQKTTEALAIGDKVIAVGGDHSINLGVMAGASTATHGDIGLIYFDAHGDMNTDETTLTGNIHGMHLAALMGFGAEKLVNAHRPGVKLRKENLVHIGGCDFDQAELDLITRENLHAFTLMDVMAHGLGPLLKMIDELSERVSNVWISLDLDAIDKVYAPGAGMPNSGGLVYREVAGLAEYIGKNCNVVGVDVVEYNPLQDIDHKTAELGIELIAKFLGKNYSWYSNYLERNQLGS